MAVGEMKERLARLEKMGRTDVSGDGLWLPSAIFLPSLPFSPSTLASFPGLGSPLFTLHSSLVPKLRLSPFHPPL